MTSFNGIDYTRRRLLAAAACAATGIGPAPAAGTALRGPIEVVIHSRYGGGTETTARMAMAALEQVFDLDLAMVSRRGGSGAAAMNYVLDRPADGRTLLAVTPSHLYTMARGRTRMGIDDIAGVARSMVDPTFIAVSAAHEVDSLEAAIDAARRDAWSWGVSQVGNTEHIGLARLARHAGFTVKAVPFGSGAAMVEGVLSGAVDAALPNVSEARALIGNGSLRALAVMAPARLARYPGVPTTYELGLPVHTATVRGFAVLAATPPEVVARLGAALVEALSQPVFARYLDGAGLSVADSVRGPVQWDRQLRADYASARSVLAELGLLAP